MKKLILCALVVGAYAMPLHAAEVDTDHLMFSEDVNEALATAEQQAAIDAQLAGTYQVALNDEVRTKAIQRKFASRRAYKTRGFDGKKPYDAEQPWVGATDVIQDDIKKSQVQRINRMFKSRRAYMP